MQRSLSISRRLAPPDDDEDATSEHTLDNGGVDANSYLLRVHIDKHLRSRGARATLHELTDEERLEIALVWDTLVGEAGELSWPQLCKAAQTVLGVGNFSIVQLRRAMQLMDLNKSGNVDWHNFRAYMANNLDAHTTADKLPSLPTVKAGAVGQGTQEVAEDMIIVGGGMRLVDLVLAFKRRSLMDAILSNPDGAGSAAQRSELVAGAMVLSANTDDGIAREGAQVVLSGVHDEPAKRVGSQRQASQLLRRVVGSVTFRAAHPDLPSDGSGPSNLEQRTSQAGTAASSVDERRVSINEGSNSNTHVPKRRRPVGRSVSFCHRRVSSSLLDGEDDRTSDGGTSTSELRASQALKLGSQRRSSYQRQRNLGEASTSSGGLPGDMLPRVRSRRHTAASDISDELGFTQQGSDYERTTGGVQGISKGNGLDVTDDAPKVPRPRRRYTMTAEDDENERAVEAQFGAAAAGARLWADHGLVGGADGEEGSVPVTERRRSALSRPRREKSSAALLERSGGATAGARLQPHTDRLALLRMPSKGMDGEILADFGYATGSAAHITVPTEGGPAHELRGGSMQGTNSRALPRAVSDASSADNRSTASGFWADLPVSQPGAKRGVEGNSMQAGLSLSTSLAMPLHSNAGSSNVARTVKGNGSSRRASWGQDAWDRSFRVSHTSLGGPMNGPGGPLRQPQGLSASFSTFHPRHNQHQLGHQHQHHGRSSDEHATCSQGEGAETGRSSSSNTTSPCLPDIHAHLHRPPLSHHLSFTTKAHPNPSALPPGLLLGTSPAVASGGPAISVMASLHANPLSPAHGGIPVLLHPGGGSNPSGTGSTAKRYSNITLKVPSAARPTGLLPSSSTLSSPSALSPAARAEAYIQHAIHRAQEVAGGHESGGISHSGEHSCL